MQKIHQAIERRSNWKLTSEAIRLIDGDGDGLPGIFLEEFSGRWLLSTTEGSVSNSVVRALESYEKSVYWKRLDQNEKESPVHLCGPLCEEPFLTKENDLSFEISFQSGYSQGIFLDQRDNRKRVQQVVRKGQRILNTFAYTGAFSVAAAAGGATTTTLDLSQPYLNWAKRNFEANQFNHDDHYFCKGDTFHWLERFAKSSRSFHGIILDPPTFSRDAKGKVFRAEKDYGRLVKLASACLEPGGWILASTNCRKIKDYHFESMVASGIPNYKEIEQLSMPKDFNGDQYLQAVWVYS